MNAHFPPIRWVLPGIVPDGLTLLAGQPKVGKSWLALQIATAKSGGVPLFGGRTPTEGEVLYLAYEDNPRRLSDRLRASGLPVNHNLTFDTQWPTGEACIHAIEEWASAHPKLSLVIVDTLIRAFPDMSGNGGATYAAESRAAGAVHSLSQRIGVPIFAVHHMRKMTSTDWVQEISGSTGLTGAADTLLGLRGERGSGVAVLSGTGRDVPDIELDLTRDAAHMVWERGGKVGPRFSAQERMIVDALQAASVATSSGELARQLGVRPACVSRALSGLLDRGLVERVRHGVYVPVRKDAGAL